jgi:hypothetical protein
MTGLRAGDGFAGRGDDFYERLLAAHSGLSDADSRALNARLVLLLAHEVGDLAVIDAALAAARRGLAPGDSKGEPE